MHTKRWIRCMALCIAVAVPAAAQQAAIQAEVVIALSVEDREPAGAGTSFPAGVGQLVAWSRITGAANTTLQHVWRYGNNEEAIPLTVGGSPWRTWSRKTIPAEWTGQWTLEVRDAAGNVLSSTTFTVGP